MAPDVEFISREIPGEQSDEDQLTVCIEADLIYLLRNYAQPYFTLLLLYFSLSLNPSIPITNNPTPSVGTHSIRKNSHS